jgi:hypothetical protein
MIQGLHLLLIINDDDSGFTPAADNFYGIAGGVTMWTSHEGDADSTTFHTKINVQGDIVGNRNLSDGIYTDSIKHIIEPPHLVASFADSSETPSMALNGWELITNEDSTLYTAYETSNITFGGDTVTFDVAGDYTVNFNLSFSGTASDAYEIAIFVNDAFYRYKSERTTSQTDVGNVSLLGYVEAAAGDNMKVMIRNTASNDDATLISSQLMVIYLHP